jgi:hypothetical protein
LLKLYIDFYIDKPYINKWQSGKIYFTICHSLFSFHVIVPVGFCKDKAKYGLRNTHLFQSGNNTDPASNPSDHYLINKDGWITYSSEDKEYLLCWVPSIMRSQLYSLQNQLVIGQNVVELDFSSFVHGPEWTKCYQAPQADN